MTDRRFGGIGLMDRRGFHPAPEVDGAADRPQNRPTGTGGRPPATFDPGGRDEMRLSVRSIKPYVPALVAATGLLVSTTAAVVYTHRLQSLTAAIVAENVSSLRAAEELELALRDIRGALYKYALSSEESFLRGLPELDRNFRQALDAARDTPVTALERRFLDDLERGYGEYAAATARLARGGPAAAGGRGAEATALADRFTDRLVPICHAFLEFNERSMEEAVRDHDRLSRRLRYVLVSAGLLVPLSGVLVGFLVSHGVSRELGRSREELLRAEQLASVGRLAAGMAHELRNPLTSILMMVQTADPDQPADLAVIEDEVRRMERTIQACLDFAKPPRPHRGAVDLCDVARDACRLMEHRVRRQRIDLILDLPGTPLVVLADRHQLHQVLVNLLLNATESVRTRGRIGLAAAADGGEAVLRVWDDGPGIPPDVLPAVFDPFVSTKAAGTGLGLSIAKRIVEDHGGRVEARNRPEGGAEFLVRLPLHEGPADGDHPVDTRDARHDGDADGAGDRRRAEHPARVPEGAA